MEEINPSVKDILYALYEWAPAELALSWDNIGQTIGSPSKRIERIICALDVSQSSIDFAIDRGAHLLVTHHPIFITPIKGILEGDCLGSRIVKAIRAGLAIISMHTNLDAAQGGVNDTLSELFMLKEVTPVEDQEGGRLLRIGEFDSPKTLKELLCEATEKLHCHAIPFTGTMEMEIKRVAVCGGSGSGYWRLAKEHGAHCLLTGELRHHDALDARDHGFPIIAAGHFETERPIVEKIYDFLKNRAKRKNWRVDLEIFTSEASPIHIFN